MGEDSAGDAEPVDSPEEEAHGSEAAEEPEPELRSPEAGAPSSNDDLPDGVVPVVEEPETDGGTAAKPSFEAPIIPSFSDPPRAITAPVIPTFEDTFGGGLLPTKRKRTKKQRERRDDSDFGIDGPEYDEEMPLADHIEEMIKRLAVVIVVAGSVTLVTFPFAEQIIVHLWYTMLPADGMADPRIYHPLEFLLTQIKVASLMGIIVALPVVVYETYAFMRPGLYPRERRYYLAAIPTSLVLAIVGVAFAYFIVLPAIFTYFMAYSTDAGEIAFALGQTFELILVLMAYLAIVFQIPLFIMLAIMMGLTTRRWLAEKRLYFWGSFLGISFLTSPDPTGMAPIIIALTMVGLFEGTLALLKWVGR